MFQSPSIRLYTSENTDSTVHRKPGNLIARKPFLDRSVNSKTPDTGNLQKSKPIFNKATVVVEKPKVSPKFKEDLEGGDFTYSFKDVDDTYEDIWAKSRLSTENLVKILQNYCNTEDTPPPSPEPAPISIDPIFFDFPSFEMPEFLLDEELLNKTLEVDLPCFDDLHL